MDSSRLKQSPTSLILRRVARAALPAVALAFGLGLSPASAQSLQDALAQAYQSNPTLDAARAQLRATDELIPQAKSGFLPTINANGSASRNLQKNGPVETYWTEKSVGAEIVQPLFRGGRTVASLSRAEALVQAQRASLQSTEQSVLLAVAQAYSDVVRDEAVLQLTVNNEQVLKRQLEAANDRFRVGEITRTDVSQSESRLALSTSNRIAAEGALNASRATFARLIGAVPQGLTQAAPLTGLPASLDATIALAEQNNPQVLAAKFSERAADAAVDQVAGELLPTVSLVGSYSRTWDRPGTLGDLDNGAILARVTVPIYEAGGTTARVREAKQTASQRRIQIDEAVRGARETGIRAWEALSTAAALLPMEEEEATGSSPSDDEEEEGNTETEHSASPSPPGGRKSLHSQKVERILHKVWRLLREFNLPKDLDYEALRREILTTLRSMPELKIRKKTVNQSTVVVSFIILKRLALRPVGVEEVIAALKGLEPSHSLSRSSKPNYSRNHSEVLGISKLVSSLESSLEGRPSPRTEDDQAKWIKACLEATRTLSGSLQLGEEVGALAARLALLSDDSSLASRHLASVSASLVLVAARRLKRKVTLTRVAEVSNVSSCTIRKAVKALEELLAQKGEPSS